MVGVSFPETDWHVTSLSKVELVSPKLDKVLKDSKY